MRATFFVLGALALLSPLAVRAQSFDAMLGNTNSFTVSANPQYPAPYSHATLSVLSSTLDLTSVTMSVSVSGKETYRGSVQPVAVQLGKAGAVVPVTVTIISSGVSYKQTLSLEPQDVTLIAEPVASTPPLYPGKPLVPLEGSVRVVAVANLRSANGKAIDPAKCSYAWTVDDTQIADASGIGKNSAMVASPLEYRSRTVSVAVASPDGSLVGGADLSLTPSEPSVRVYENDPLLGVRYERALSGTYAISGAEDTLYAGVFSMPTSGSVPLVQWFLNGSLAQTGNSITLRPAGSGQGSASLSAVASSGAYTKATADLSLSFGAAAGFNFFGL